MNSLGDLLRTVLNAGIAYLVLVEGHSLLEVTDISIHNNPESRTVIKICVVNVTGEEMPREGID